MGAIQDILDKFGRDTVQIIQDNLSSTGTNASGQTSQSLRSESTSNSVKVSGKAFIFVVETGRKPGRRPPVSKIKQWLESGKVSFQGKIESVAFAISKKIGEQGSKLFREGGRHDIITPAIKQERVDELTKQIADVSFKQTLKLIDNGITNNN